MNPTTVPHHRRHAVWRALNAAALAAVLASGFGFAGGLGASAAFAAPHDDDPFVGDVPYVPTPQDVVDTMLTIAKVGPTDYLIDLGSGDGRIVVTAAAKFGARGFGVDLNPKRIAEAVANAKAAGVTDRAQFFQKNLFETDFSQATVVTMYLLPDINLQLRPKVLDMKPGTRIVSHDFDMGDWRPDQAITMRSADTGYSDRIYFWLVPAKVAGQWRWTEGNEHPTLTLEQSYQYLTPKLTGAKGWVAGEGTLKGDEILVTAKDTAGRLRVYTGHVTGDSIEGTIKGPGGDAPWRATRVSAAQ